MTSSMSRLIHKKWPPLEDIEARDLKFCMGPCITYTHAVKKMQNQSENIFKNWITLVDIVVFYLYFPTPRVLANKYSQLCS